MADNFTEVPMKGKKGHNVAAPGTDNIGVIAGRATNAAPTYTEGNLVLLSTDLAGALRVSTSGTQTVSGTIELGAATLAALENTSVTVSNATIAVTQSGAWSVDVSDTTLAVTQSGTWTVALDSASLTALENTTVTVGNASLAVTGPLTDTQLRAAPVDVDVNLPLGAGGVLQVEITNSGDVSASTVALDAPTLAALESVTVSGTVELGATALAALESITATGPLTDAQLRATPVPVDISDTTLAVTQSGVWSVDVSDATLAATQSGTWTVALDSAALTALENVGVTGTVELGSTSLAALETINAAQSGTWTVALDSAALTALETITISNASFGVTGALPAGDNNIGNVDIVTMPAVTLDAGSLAALETTTANQGTAAALTAPWSVRLSDGAAALGTPSNPISIAFNETSGTLADSGLLTSASVAAGASATFNSAALTTGTPRLLEVTASSSARLRVEVQTYNGATATPQRVFFVKENDSFQYGPRDVDALQVAAGAGVTFRLVVTNMDNVNAADVYASMTWSV